MTERMTTHVSGWSNRGGGWNLFWTWLVALVLAPRWAVAETRIVVNVGPYPSAEVAGRNEAEVDWLDADPTDDTVCTACFAALELQAYLRQLHGWALDPQRRYRGQLCVGEYYNVSGYRSLPICFMHTMARDIPYYYNAGARHFHYMHVTTANWGNKALTNYQMARQLWDVHTDCEALWADYFQKRYGAAAAANASVL